MRTDIDTDFFKGKLTEELLLVEKELERVGSKNPSAKNDWEADSGDLDTDNADEGEVADKMEELENNSGILTELESKRKDLEDALAKIKSGNYGICEVSGESIEEDRLMANPSARTCKAHMG